MNQEVFINEPWLKWAIEIQSIAQCCKEKTGSCERKVE